MLYSIRGGLWLFELDFRPGIGLELALLGR
jgi:hypothetical protein